MTLPVLKDELPAIYHVITRIHTWQFATYCHSCPCLKQFSWPIKSMLEQPVLEFACSRPPCGTNQRCNPITTPFSLSLSYQSNSTVLILVAYVFSRNVFGGEDKDTQCRHVDDMADMSCRHVAYSGQCLGPQRKTTSGTRVMWLNVADISW